jgi:hypothetical protein
MTNKSQQLDMQLNSRVDPRPSRLRRFHDVDHGDDARTLLSLNASYTLLRLNPSLRLVVVPHCAVATLASLAQAHQGKHCRTGSCRVVIGPCSQQQRVLQLQTDGRYRCSKCKNSALSASAKTLPTRRRRMPQSAATVEKT